MRGLELVEWFLNQFREERRREEGTEPEEESEEERERQVAIVAQVIKRMVCHERALLVVESCDHSEDVEDNPMKKLLRFNSEYRCKEPGMVKVKQKKKQKRGKEPKQDVR